MTTCLLLVPGFKGSILTSGGRRAWLSAREALVGRASLAYHRPDLGVENPVSYAEGGILDRVPIVPGLLSSDVYGPTLRALRRAAPEAWWIRAWHFDWRRDPNGLVDDLDAFVGSIAAEGADDIRILAHSMGGMLTAAWLRRPGVAAGAGGRVTRVAFIAAAFRGTTKIFRNFHTGDDPVGRNTTLLGADALCTMPSCYAFLPSAWPLVVDPLGAPVASDFRDVALWERERWGLFRDGRTGLAPARRAFLAERFSTSAAFLDGIERMPRAPDGLRIHNVIGVGVGTVHRLIRRDDGSLVLTERERRADPRLASLPIEASGDGTLTDRCAELPPAFAAIAGDSMRVRAGHMAIVQRGPGLDASLRFLTAR